MFKTVQVADFVFLHKINFSRNGRNLGFKEKRWSVVTFVTEICSQEHIPINFSVTFPKHGYSSSEAPDWFSISEAF